MTTCHQFGEWRSHARNQQHMALERGTYRRVHLRSAFQHVAQLVPKHVKIEGLLEEVHSGVYRRATS
jgi:hypothetical protein